jgi:hypothetical protein
MIVIKKIIPSQKPKRTRALRQKEFQEAQERKHEPEEEMPKKKEVWAFPTNMLILIFTLSIYHRRNKAGNWPTANLTLTLKHHLIFCLKLRRYEI